MSYTRPPRLEPEPRRGGIRPRSPSEMLEPSRPPAPPRKGKGRARPTAVGPFIRLGSSVFTLLLAIMIGGLGLAALLYHEFERPGPLEIARTVVVPEGSSSNEISELLEKNGIIASRWPFMIGFLAESRLGPKKKMLKHGEYLIKPHASMRDIIDVLAEGKAVQYKVTIPEGLTSQQIVERLKAEENLTGDIAAVPPEGTLYPETYGIEKGMTRAALLERMKEKMQQFLATAWEKRKPGLLLKTPQEAVVFASIVEKETGRPDERDRVAAVFMNRLHKGMRLQSDPTVIYGIVGGQGPLGRPLTRADLDQKSTHNTYQIDGLPPTPICNPGRPAIEAALNPATTNDLYFVADGTGGHVFSDTLKEHNAAVSNWRKVERERAKKEAETAPAAAIPAPPATSADAPAPATDTPPATKDAAPVPVRKPKKTSAKKQ
jgi:UPF0755 protein